MKLMLLLSDEAQIANRRDAELRAAGVAERRAREKELKKAKKRARAEAEEDGSAPLEPRPKRIKVTPRPFNARIVIDLDFDDLMTEKVAVRLSLLRSYPSHLVVTPRNALRSVRR